MTIQDDAQGLRRRSPNPNADSPHLDAPDATATPIPYSPGLLSPYAHRDNHAFSSARSPASVYTPFVGTAPTIRLIPARRTTGDEPSPIARSRSDDVDDRHPQDAVSSLKRRTTDPSYTTLRRGQADDATYMLSRPNLDKPVPPIPPDAHPRRHDSVRSRNESENGRQAPPSELDSMDGASAGTGRKTWSSLLVNPFKAVRGPGQMSGRMHRDHSTSTSSTSSSRGLRPLHLLAPPMSRKTSSMSSLATIVDTDDGAMSLTKIQSTSSASSTAIDSKILELVRSAGGDKITAKFPERNEAEDQEWTSFKMVLLLSVLTLFGYGLAALCWALQIMLRISQDSDVTMVSDPDVVTFLLLFSLLALFTSFVGLTGTLLFSRPILAFYNLLLWPTFISLALVGCSSYKRGSLQLDRKLNQVWSQFLNQEDRLRIQNALGCCGYYNPFHDATYSKKCFPRTPLPGCKGKWTDFEQQALHDFATAAFSTVPIHIVNIVIALVCSNHVDRQFGKGVTPIKYRLQAADVRANALAVLSTLHVSIPPDSKRAPSPARSFGMFSPASSSPISRTLSPHTHARSHSTPIERYSSPAPGRGNSVTRVRTGEFGLPRPPHSRFSSMSFGRAVKTDERRDSTIHDREQDGPR